MKVLQYMTHGEREWKLCSTPIPGKLYQICFKGWSEINTNAVASFLNWNHIKETWKGPAILKFSMESINDFGKENGSN